MGETAVQGRARRGFWALVWHEVRRPGGLVLALIVGTTLTFARGLGPAAAVLPFVVPFVVSVLTRASGRWAARRRDLLLDLPGYRRDPAVIVNEHGEIVAATGLTQALFERHAIRHIDRLLVPRAASTEPDRRLAMAGRIALHHHQHCDGGGYPRVIDESGRAVFPQSRDVAVYRAGTAPAGEQIPVEALNVSLGDKDGALRSARQYQPVFSHAQAVALLTHDDRSGPNGAAVFGDRVFQAFLDDNATFEAIYAQSAGGGAAAL